MTHPTHATMPVSDGNDGSRLLTTDEVAVMLGTGPRFVRRLVTERRIPFIKVGRHVRFTASDVTEFIEAGRVHAFYRAPTRGW
jgi:excisionase family DNA binding protein